MSGREMTELKPGKSIDKYMRVCNNPAIGLVIDFFLLEA